MRAVADFPCEVTAVSSARAFVREELHGLPEDLLHAAQLLTSELASNAVIHAKTGFSVSVERLGEEVRVEVGDRGDGGYQVRSSRVGPGGHGLFLVRSLASRSGFETRGRQHVAWFELELHARADLDAKRARLVGALGSADDAPGLLAIALDGAMELLGADLGTAQLCDRGTGTLWTAANRGFGAEALRHLSAPDDPMGSVGRALAASAQVAIPDVETDAGFEANRALAAGSGFRAVLTTPLLHDGAVVGVISVYFREPRELASTELAAMRRFADAVTERLVDFDLDGLAPAASPGVPG